MCAHITLMHYRWGGAAKTNIKTALLSKKEKVIACNKKVRKGGGGEGSVGGRRKNK